MNPMKMSLDIVDFIMLALSLHGFILSILLFYNSKTIVSNRWIGGFVFVVSESTLIMELDYSGIWVNHQWLMLGMLQLNMALGPLTYLYVRSLVFEKDTGTWKNYLLFAPVLLNMKHQIIFLLYITGLLSIPFVRDFYSLSITQTILFGPAPIVVTLSFISFAVYSFVSYKMITTEQHDNNLSIFRQADLKWVKNLLRFAFALLVVWLVSIINNFNPIDSPREWEHYIIYIPAIVSVYWLGMMAYRRQSKMTKDERIEYSGKPVKILFSTAEVENYTQQLTRLMTSEYLYLDPLLKLEQLSLKLSIPEKSLSNLLNQHIGRGFNDFVNDYRIDEAKKRLTDPVWSNFTIAAIAFDCGFNSLATFQRVFKQSAGVTPSYYQNNLKFKSLTANTAQIGI